MNIFDSQTFESYVPVYDAIPEKWEDGRAFIVEQLKKLALAVNVREIGFFLDEEVLSGKSFIPGLNDVADGGTTQQFRTILRKVIDFGPLPNNTIKSVPHGIVFDANFTLIQIWASATDPVNFIAIPIPFASTGGAGGNVMLTMDSVNFNITTSSDRTAFIRCFVFCEYIQEI